MDYEYISLKIGYPCIFDNTTDCAIKNLYRLISNKQCGYNEGQEKWIEILKDILEEDYNLQKCNLPGATFSNEEWTFIFNELIKGNI